MTIRQPVRASMTEQKKCVGAVVRAWDQGQKNVKTVHAKFSNL